MQKKSIYVAYTGGTIGMQRSEQGYIPVSGHLQRQLALMPEFHRPEMPDFTIHEYTPLMDSRYILLLFRYHDLRHISFPLYPVQPLQRQLALPTSRIQISPFMATLFFTDESFFPLFIFRIVSGALTLPSQRFRYHSLMQKKSIYVAYTGGTIGMQRSEQGYIPVSGHLQRQLALMPEFHRPEMPDFTIHEYTPLMDSSDMTPEDWQHIAEDIKAHYDDYDGFVILHGTDTMAYTASALSFMLENLGKPVIVTGSQIPLAELRSDGQINLLNALYVAANYPINEVTLFFNNRLYRGNRTTKAHADGFDAFASPNLPPLLEAGIHIRRLNTPPAPHGEGELIVHPITPQPIGVVTIYPGISADVVRNFLRQPVKALILRSYGVGNAPQNKAFLQELQEASDRGIVVVNLTQCMSGKVNMGGYATGNALAHAGVIGGADMTVEATLTKLHYLLSQELDTETIRKAMSQNLRGELTPDD